MPRLLAPPAVRDDLWRGVVAAAKMRDATRQRPYETGLDWGRNRDAEPYPWQQEPAGWARLWIMLGGRGTGKTELGARKCIEHLRQEGARARVGVGAPTIADARSVCAEGETGLITLFASEFTSYNRTLLEARHRLGGYVRFLGSEEPGRWNGPQWSLLWADELALWNRESWDQADFGLRLGDHPRCIATTTPKAKKWVRDLALDSADPASGTVVTRGSTYDATGLPEDAKERWRRRYEGTRLGRQELLAEFVTDVEGAMWEQDWIDNARVAQAPELARVVIAVDPAVTHNAESDETGIAACGRGVAPCAACRERGHDSDFYVLHAQGYRLSPDGWARKAIDLNDQHEGDRIIAERNNGGEMVEATLRQAGYKSTKTIHASRGKTVRAEPVAALYEQGRVHHVGIFAELEEQQTSFPIANELDDVLDAVVYAITELEDSGWILE